MIPLQQPLCLGSEQQSLATAMQQGLYSNGPATQACEQLLQAYSGAAQVLLTPSATAALEMAALLAQIQPGDQVLMASFNFPSAANAFVLRGAQIIFSDIDPATMNLDPALLERAYTPRLRAVVAMHYGGVACDLAAIQAFCRTHGLVLIEDAAQAIGAGYQGQPLGSLGDYGCYSFHYTKNLTMGEGGALLLRNPQDSVRAEQIRDKGTNRGAFCRGEVDFYSWQESGGSYCPSELAAAYLQAQLPALTQITAERLRLWQLYQAGLQPLAVRERLRLAQIPSHAQPNGHLYYLKTRDEAERQHLQQFLAQRGISSAAHFRPLHSAPAGRKYGSFLGEDRYTSRESACLLRLPLFYGLSDAQITDIITAIEDFYHGN